MDLQNIEKAVVILAILKARRTLLKDHSANIEKQLQDILAETGLGQEIQRVKTALDDINIKIAEADQLLRGMALDMFNATDNKHLHPAVTVKEYTVLKYDVEAALDHARFHLPQAVKLNKREFEKIAKVTTFDFVTRLKEHRATIAGDLSEWATPSAETSMDAASDE